MNRAQRRAQNKQLPRAARALTPEQRQNAIIRNGITPKDLEKEYHDGHKAGFYQGYEVGSGFYMRVCYAAAIRAFSQQPDYTVDKGVAFMRLMDTLVLHEYDTEAAANAAFAEAGVDISFKEPMTHDRITEAHK